MEMMHISAVVRKQSREKENRKPMSTAAVFSGQSSAPKLDRQSYISKFASIKDIY